MANLRIFAAEMAPFRPAFVSGLRGSKTHIALEHRCCGKSSIETVLVGVGVRQLGGQQTGDFERALETDPSYARGHTGLSPSHFNEWSGQAWPKWDETERLAYDSASRAAALDDGDPMVQLGRTLLYRRRFDEAAFHVDRALSLNPNDTDVLVHAAMCRAYLGDGESALALGTRAMRLHPGFPLSSSEGIFCSGIPGVSCSRNTTCCRGGSGYRCSSR